MEIRTVLLIILAAIAALTIVFYQYFFKAKRKGWLRIQLAILRFLVLFGAFLLLINPQFIDNEYFLEKSNLVLLLDDSSSMLQSSSEDQIGSYINQLSKNQALNERFSKFQFRFGGKMIEGDSLTFQQGNTNIANALYRLNELFINGNNSVLLVSDGNQTLGRDYEFLNLNERFQVNTLVVGDTTSYDDISIGQVNTNTYAFLDNKFPLEAVIQYNGKKNVSKTLTITMDGKRVFRENLGFSSTKNSIRINTLIKAERVGLKSLEFSVAPLNNEKNIVNNTKTVALEVIDEKTNVTLVSDMMHPDIGALKKSIESNEQRQMTVVAPDVSEEALEKTDVLILYQPNNRFKKIYDYLKTRNLNYFTITGTQTDWRFLNQVQDHYFKEGYNQKEEILPIMNRSFSSFSFDGFDAASYPPLISNLGDLEIKADHEDVIYQQIKGVNLDVPLLALVNGSNCKEAVLFGENLWRWRAKSFLENNDFSTFDGFLGRLVLFLNSNEKRSRLELDYKTVYDGSGPTGIRASYFDKGFEIDPNGDLEISISGTDSEYQRIAPMLFKGSFFEYDLSNLNPGTYRFTVTEKVEGLSKSGTFKIIQFEQEDLTYSSNYTKLQRLAVKTGGKSYFPQQLEELTNDLLNSEHTIPVQKSRQNVVSLIDFRIVLGLMVLCLAMEWFIRKYNGLI